jgi:ABC-type glycerol-3-phosphate transport system permease component
MPEKSLFTRLLVYALLLGGALVFSLPFVWMVGTSVKVDRELFADGLHFFPESPRPRLQSPYIDDAFYGAPDAVLDPAKTAALVEVLQAHPLPPLPADLDAAAVQAGVVRGLYERLSRILKGPEWEDNTAFRARLDSLVNERMVTDAVNSVHRRLCLGQLRVRSQGLAETVLGAERPFSERWVNRTPAVARLVEQQQSSLHYTSLNYDFRQGSEVTLEGAYNPGFDPADLQRVQLYLKPDDTWHELDLGLEMNGRRYVAQRRVAMANYNWTLITWQFPSADDSSTKIKTWVLLHEAKDAVGAFNEPGRLRLTLRLCKSTPLRAWYSKIRLNYDRVLDHIPFWRYVRTSIFLVVANVVLTVFSCSLIAFAFARLNWPGRDICFLLMLATLMIPGQVTMIPHFLIWKHLGAYDTLTPLWLGSAFGNAFFIFLLRQFMRSIPRDLEDAALIDGCGYLRIYWHIILPLIKPSLAAIAIFTFMGTWNDFMGPLLYVADQRLYPLAFGLYAFSVQVGNNPALTMAASLLMTLPVIAIFFVAQKYFIQGVTLTGIKG